MPRVGADLLLSGIDRVLVGDIEFDRDDPVALLDVVGIARAGEDDEAVVRGSCRAISAPIPRLVPLTSATLRSEATSSV